jgi:hypothetical protein
MKFSVSSTDLLSHLQVISRVINSKNSLPILDNFLQKVDNKEREVVYKGHGTFDSVLESSIEKKKNVFFQSSLFAKGYQTPNKNFKGPKLKWIFCLFLFFWISYFITLSKLGSNLIKISGNTFNPCLVQINIQKE